MRDWKLQNLANGKEISAARSKNGERRLPLEVVYNFERISKKIISRFFG